MKPSNQPKKPPRKIDAAYLDRAALYYLERFASSAENFRRVLKLKIDRRAKARGEEPAQFYDLIDPLVQRYVASGLLNDAVYAQGQVASLRRRGGSKRMIAAKMNAKGIKGEALETAMEENPTDELEAAHNYARRRKLGPWRTKARVEHYDKDLASLARAGFSFSHAKIVLAQDEIER